MPTVASGVTAIGGFFHEKIQDTNTPEGQRDDMISNIKGFGQA